MARLVVYVWPAVFGHAVFPTFVVHVGTDPAMMTMPTRMITPNPKP